MDNEDLYLNNNDMLKATSDEISELANKLLNSEEEKIKYENEENIEDQEGEGPSPQHVQKIDIMQSPEDETLVDLRMDKTPRDAVIHLYSNLRKKNKLVRLKEYYSPPWLIRKDYKVRQNNILNYDGLELLDQNYNPVLGINPMDKSRLILYSTCTVFIAIHTRSTYFGNITPNFIERFDDLPALTDLPEDPLLKIYFVSGSYCKLSDLERTNMYNTTFNFFLVLKNKGLGDRLELIDELQLVEDKHYIGYDHRLGPFPFIFDKKSLSVKEKKKYSEYMTLEDVQLKEARDESKKTGKYREKRQKQIEVARRKTELYRREAKDERKNIHKDLMSHRQETKEWHKASQNERTNMSDKMDTYHGEAFGWHKTSVNERDKITGEMKEHKRKLDDLHKIRLEELKAEKENLAKRIKMQNDEWTRRNNSIEKIEQSRRDELDKMKQLLKSQESEADKITKQWKDEIKDLKKERGKLGELLKVKTEELNGTRKEFQKLLDSHQK